MLSSAALAAMRSVQEDTFDLSATIKRPGAYTSDNAGGSTASETTVATVACRLAPDKTSDSERIAAGRIQAGALWRITMPQGTDVQIKDKIEIGSRTFDVASLWGPHTYDTALVALAVER